MTHNEVREPPTTSPALRGMHRGAVAGLAVGAAFAALSPGYLIAVPIFVAGGAVTGALAGLLWSATTATGRRLGGDVAPRDSPHRARGNRAARRVVKGIAIVALTYVALILSSYAVLALVLAPLPSLAVLVALGASAASWRFRARAGRR